MTVLSAALSAALLASLFLPARPAQAASSSTEPADLEVVTLRQGVAAAGVGLTAMPLDAATYAKNGRTMAPLRFTAESFGATVDWSPERPLDVVIRDGSVEVKLTQGSSTAYINGKQVSLDAPAEVKNDRTFVPVRFVSEAFRAEVLYEADTRSVVISRLGHAPSLSELELYVLQLVNLDRLTNSLEPVQWDGTAAQAGRVHAEEMARAGYFSHWGLDGQLPGYRYTQAGGADHVAENLAKMWFEGGSADQYPRPDFLRMISQEAGLMNSQGHRANILGASHTHLGVGLATDGKGGTYLAQEFVDRYGVYEPLPQQAKPGQSLRVSGTLDEGIRFFAVSLGRADVSPLTVEQLNRTSSYSEPSPAVSYFPAGYVSPRPVEVSGQRFQVDLLPEHLQTPGTYYIYIWATLGDSNKPVLVSSRTVVVAP